MDQADESFLPPGILYPSNVMARTKDTQPAIEQDWENKNEEADLSIL